MSVTFRRLQVQLLRALVVQVYSYFLTTKPLLPRAGLQSKRTFSVLDTSRFLCYSILHYRRITSHEYCASTHGKYYGIYCVRISSYRSNLCDSRVFEVNYQGYFFRYLNCAQVSICRHIKVSKNEEMKCKYVIE